MNTVPDTDDNKGSASDEKEGIDTIESNPYLDNELLQNLALEHASNKSTIANTHSPSKHHNKKQRNKSRNSINSVLEQEPIKKEEKREPIPSLTRICLEIVYQNITGYPDFDFLPEDLAVEILMMVVDRQALNRETARPFLSTNHGLIRKFCKKYIDLSRLPAHYNYGCRGI